MSEFFNVFSPRSPRLCAKIPCPSWLAQRRNAPSRNPIFTTKNTKSTKKNRTSCHPSILRVLRALRSGKVLSEMSEFGMLHRRERRGESEYHLGGGSFSLAEFPLERVLKIDRGRDCGRGGADGEARRRRISLVDLRLRSNEANRPAPPQDRPRYFQNTLLALARSRK